MHTRTHVDQSCMMAVCLYKKAWIDTQEWIEHCYKQEWIGHCCKQEWIGHCCKQEWIGLTNLEMTLDSRACRMRLSWSLLPVLNQTQA